MTASALGRIPVENQEQCDGNVTELGANQAVTLAGGTRLGAYEIVEQIGSGGMGEVYRATDTSLKRDVAIKVLPPFFAEDQDRLARFRREAELLASLNHPNIAHIYGLEESEGATAIVMELVEGPTLADRITEGPLLPDEALAIARQITGALEAAHALSIVHRDLKPANIKLKSDGTVKVLDFGIAKGIDPQAVSGGSPVMTTPAVTQTGMILGTAAYMSPEQARGKFVDERTDIWAFGCLLYEMLTGQPAFGGEDVMLTLARVLDRETDMSSIPGTISRAVRHTIRLCLEKDPAKRIADIRDVRLALEGRFESELPAGMAQAAVRSPLWRRTLGPIMILFVGVAIGVVVSTRLVDEPSGDVTRFSFDTEAPIGNGDNGDPIAISPNGQLVVYHKNNQLYLRRLDQRQSTPIPGTENGHDVFFSPDGRQVAFFTDDELKAVGFSGEQPTVLAAIKPATGLVGTWDERDRILFGQGGSYPIYEVPAVGGTPEVLAELGDYADLDYPQVLPGGEWVLFSAAKMNGNWSEANIVVQNIATGDREVVHEGGHFARYVDTGHLVFVREGVLYAVVFDLATRQIVPPIVPLEQDVSYNEGSGQASYAIAQNGTLVYAPGTAAGGDSVLVAAALDGTAHTLTTEPHAYGSLRVSPDATRVAAEITDPGSGDIHIWIVDLAADDEEQLTFDGAVNRNPVWTPDGESIIYASDRDGVNAVWMKSADGTGEPLRLFETGDSLVVPEDMLDDSTLLYDAIGARGDTDLITYEIENGDEPVPFLASKANELYGRVSPNGRWIAYMSDESGEPRIYVRPYPATGGGQRAVSSNSGFLPVWSASGDQIYYLGQGGMMAAAVQTTPTSISVERAVEIFDFSGRFLGALGGSRSRPFDYLEGEAMSGIVVLQSPVDDAAEANAGDVPRLNVVLNWFEELRERVPVK